MAEPAHDPTLPWTQPDAEAIAREGVAMFTGTSLGRYRVQRVLGHGGMGVVLLALDPILGRQVAIKLLRGRVWAHGEAGQARARLHREAQAMAKLAHPNVVTVHEVGGDDQSTYIVMELVDGGTAAAWRAERPRGWRETVEVYLQAGEGLAAAHRSGLIHRDFKPENVLVGRDGRVRVADFGIAGAVGAAVDQPPGQDGGAKGSGQTPGSTRTASLIGTPGYAAPEQMRCEAVDARADQFSFAVALYGALYGALPYAGKSFPAVLRALEQPLPEPPASPVPAWLRRVLLVALAPSPDRRYPSMVDLLGALRADPGRRRRRWLGAAALVTLGGGAVALAFSLASSPLPSAPPPCGAGAARLAGVWDHDARAGVLAGLRQSGRRHADTTFARVDARLRLQTASWIDMHQQSCEATYVRHEQSEALLDLRTACLEGRRQELAAFVRLLSDAPTPAVVDSAAQAAEQLSPIADCGDGPRLQAAAPLPTDPGTRALVTQALADGAELTVMLRLGEADAAARYAALVARVGHVEYAPLQAELALFRATLAERSDDDPAAEQAWNEAVALAAKARDAPREAEGWVGLLVQLAHQAPRRDEALRIQLAAQAALERAGWPWAATFRYRRALAVMEYSVGHVPEALDLARELVDDAASRDASSRAEALYFYAKVLRVGTSPADLGAAAAQALVAWEELVGPEHPTVAEILVIVATAERRLGRLADADVALTRALGIQESVLGLEHLDLCDTLVQLSNLAAERDDLPAVRRHFTRALAIATKAGPAESTTYLEVAVQGGHALIALRRFDEAAETLGKVVAWAGGAGVGAEPGVAIAHFYLGTALVELGRFAEALVHCETAAPRLAELFGAKSDAFGSVLLCQGEALLGLGRAAAAVDHAERALALVDDGESDPGEVAVVRFALARALAGARRDPRRALTLASAAATELKAAGAPQARALAEVEAWLAGHDPRP